MDLPNWLYNQLPENKCKSYLVFGGIRSGFLRSLVVLEAWTMLVFPRSTHFNFTGHPPDPGDDRCHLSSQYFIINSLENGLEAQPPGMTKSITGWTSSPGPQTSETDPRWMPASEHAP